MAEISTPEFLAHGGTEIAVRRNAGGNPGVVWLGGFRSHMRGAKAEAIAAHARQQGLACCRHDYSGHGESGGRFGDGTISKWLAESLAVFKAFTSGPQILIGSSMGAWIALRMMQELQKTEAGGRVAGLLLIAPAPDFTSELHWPRLSDEQKQALETDGRIEVPSAYSPDEPTVLTRSLFEDGARNRVLDGIFETRCPVHIVQGMADPDVPFTHALRLAEHLPADDVTVTLVKDGDHRLSREQDIALILRTLDGLAGLADAGASR